MLAHCRARAAGPRAAVPAPGCESHRAFCWWVRKCLCVKTGIAHKVCEIARSAIFHAFCRFAMNCPRCNHHHTQKIGLSRHKRQRWMCMGCRRTFGDRDLRLVDPKTKALALAMYAEGIAARKIERLLHVSHNAVLGRVRKEVAGKALQAPAAKDLSVIEADEMWSYVGSKNSPSGCGGP